MGRFMRVSGSEIKCMGKEKPLGLMEDFMMGSFTMINEKDMGFISGKMGENMRANGRRESKMGLENIQIKRER